MPQILLDSNLVIQVVQSRNHCIDLAKAKYSRDFPTPEISWELKGKVAGRMERTREGKYILHINYSALSKYPEDYIQNTLPHEMAHLIARELFPYRISPHGREWQSIMVHLFGLEPSRCHSYKLEKARKVGRPFVYACDCREHKLTSILHKRIQDKGQRRACTSCRAEIVFSREEN